MHELVCVCVFILVHIFINEKHSDTLLRLFLCFYKFLGLVKHNFIDNNFSWILHRQNALATELKVWLINHIAILVDTLTLNIISVSGSGNH